MYVVVAGGGKVGFNLASTLLEEGHEVLLIEKDLGRFMALENILGENVLNGDASQVRVLEAAGAGRADVVVAVTGRDEDNIVTCQIAKEHLGAKRVIGRINNPKNEATFADLGIKTTVGSTRIIYRLLSQEVDADGIIPLIPLKQGNLTVLEIVLKDNSPAANKKVKELFLPSNAVLLALTRDDEVLIPKGDTTLKAGDILVALVRKGEETALRKVFAANGG